ncbi:MAG: hypothetical protein E6J82_18775 [Deltaproteobacteria bacterium]|nr:MAG: hypothetical protein E6J82_18775 [Deltaproteobacteria bacterium]
MKAFDPTHVTVAALAGDTFLKGQLVEMTCAQGSNPTIGQVAATAQATSAADLQLTLDAAVAGNPYRANIPAAHDSCFDTAGVSLFLVNRYRYHVATVNGDPWLMLDRGLDYNQNGTTAEEGAGGAPDTADEIPIAHGLEGMQFAYLLRPSTTGVAAPDNGGDWVIGNTPGVIEGYNLHPANIRGVRIRLTVRSLRLDITQPSDWFGDPATPPDGSASIENCDNFVVVTLGRYRRYFSSATVSTPNLGSKDPFIF